MEEDRLRAGKVKQLRIHMVGTEDLLPLRGFRFLSHAGPHIGVNNFCATARHRCIVGKGASGACLGPAISAPTHSFRIRLITRRSRHPYVRAEL